MTPDQFPFNKARNSTQRFLEEMVEDGEVSEPVITQDGTHVYQLTEGTLAKVLMKMTDFVANLAFERYNRLPTEEEFFAIFQEILDTPAGHVTPRAQEYLNKWAAKEAIKGVMDEIRDLAAVFKDDSNELL